MPQKILLTVAILVISLFPLPVAFAVEQRQISSVLYEFTESIDRTSLARELGIASEKITVTRILGGCTVEFERPIKIHHNQLYDGRGNLISEEIIEFNDLEEWQVEVLHRFMTDANCGKFLPR